MGRREGRGGEEGRRGGGEKGGEEKGGEWRGGEWKGKGM